MRPQTYRTMLRVFLVLCGVLTLFALPAVFMPTEMMDSFHRDLGLGELPKVPIVDYLTRSLSAFYAAFGSLTLVLAWDLVRFRPLVVWWGATALVFGVLLIGIDLHAGMPLEWMLGEGPFLILAGCLVFALLRLSRFGDNQSGDAPTDVRS